MASGSNSSGSSIADGTTTCCIEEGERDAVRSTDFRYGRVRIQGIDSRGR